MATQNLEMIPGFVYSFTQALSLVNPPRSHIQCVILGRSYLKALRRFSSHLPTMITGLVLSFENYASLTSPPCQGFIINFQIHCIQPVESHSPSCLPRMSHQPQKGGTGTDTGYLNSPLTPVSIPICIYSFLGKHQYDGKLQL